MKRFLIPIVVCVFTVFSFNAKAGPLVNSGGTAATPSVYKVIVEKIEFGKSDSTYFTFYTGSTALDIASVSAGETVANLGAGTEVPAGTYTTLRLTFSKNFTVKGSVSDAGSSLACQTSSSASGTTTLSNVVMTDAEQSSSGASEQTISIPLDSGGTTVYDAMTSASITMLNSSGTALSAWTAAADAASIRVEFTLPSSLVVTADSSVQPTMSVTFQVTSKLEFLTTGAGTCVVMNLPPVFTVTVNGNSSSFSPSL